MHNEKLLSLNPNLWLLSICKMTHSIKLSCNGEYRRIPMSSEPNDLNFMRLLETVKNLFPDLVDEDLSFTWNDGENDIVMSTTEELHEAIRVLSMMSTNNINEVFTDTVFKFEVTMVLKPNSKVTNVSNVVNDDHETIRQGHLVVNPRKQGLIEEKNDNVSVSGNVSSGSNTFADSEGNKFRIIEVDRGLWDFETFQDKKTELPAHRPTGGEPGVAYMTEDKQWVPISLDLKSHVDANYRKRHGSPSATRGKTQYRFYKSLDSEQETVDHYSDGDETIKQVHSA